jgi:LmbE family N-acetylglucosaminyl deacetylase
MIIEFAELSSEIGLRDRLMVIAPHPDDETLGCGGLIALAANNGLDVLVVVMTDGAASHPNSRSWPPRRLASQRRLELAQALGTLGVGRSSLHMDLPDSRTESISRERRQNALRMLSDAISRFEPDVVATTWRREPHCDHRFAFELTREAMADARSEAALVEYLVWTGVIGLPEDLPRPDEGKMLRLDISDVRAIKLRAVEAFRSQLGLIQDDPSGFSLTAKQIEQMTGLHELIHKCT